MNKHFVASVLYEHLLSLIMGIHSFSSVILVSLPQIAHLLFLFCFRRIVFFFVFAGCCKNNFLEPFDVCVSKPCYFRVHATAKLFSNQEFKRHTARYVVCPGGGGNWYPHVLSGEWGGGGGRGVGMDPGQDQ